MKVRIYDPSHYYTIRRWMTDNFGAEDYDWWFSGTRYVNVSDLTDRYSRGRENTIAFRNPAHETYCMLVCKGEYLTPESMTYNA